MKIHKQKNILNHAFFQEAKRLVLLARKAEEISHTEISDSWKDVKIRLSSNKRINNYTKRKVRYYFIWESVAAVVLIGILIFCAVKPRTTNPVMAELQKSSLTIDNLKEISLITTEHGLTRVENRSDIKYCSNGTLMINNKPIESLSSTGMNNLYVPHGQRVNLTLSDGTKMYVNAGSHIVYPTTFDKNKREIAVEGEVFLEVTHNPNRPFIVKTSRCNVKVLGTKFNVSAYKDRGQTSVVLVKGSVAVKTAKNKKVLLHPDEMFRFSSDEIEVKKVDVLKYICWKDNIMIIEDDRIGKVINNIAQYYGINAHCDANISDIKISGKLDLCENAEDVFDAIQEIAPVYLKKTKENNYYFTDKIDSINNQKNRTAYEK